MSGFVRYATVRDSHQSVGRACRTRVNRSCIPPLLAVLLMAAAPAPSRPLPIPPIPPPQRDEAPAPVPDPDAAPPPQPEATGPTVVPRFLHVPTYQNQFDPSAGYVTGSRVQEDQTDRRLAPSPGVRLEIPLR